MHKDCEFRLRAGAGLHKGLLQLASSGSHCDAHRIGGGLQPVAMGDSNRRLSFAIGKVERSPQRVDARIIDPIRVADKDGAAGEIVCFTRSSIWL